MIDISEFFDQLKNTLEKHSDDLRQGKVFLPEYLPGRQFTNTFRQIPQKLATKLQLQISEEVWNPFLPDYNIGGSQRVDFVFRETGSDARPVVFSRSHRARKPRLCGPLQRWAFVLR